jgi:hypothetical protein
VQAILQGMSWRLLAVAVGLAAYGMLVRPCVATFSSSPEQAWPRLVQAGEGRAVAMAMATDGAGASRSRSVTPPGGPGGGGRRLVAGGWLRARGLIPAGGAAR